MCSTPLITIFTATYNRVHTLHRVFDSLRAQTLQDFEWLIVDDGSTDATSNLVARWIDDASFPIRYLQQPHSGKHIAHNRGIHEARGEFFLTLDSDDEVLPEALARLIESWKSIPVENRGSFCGAAGLSCDVAGRVIGTHFPDSPLDATLRELHYIFRVRGEKCLMVRTEIVRRYRFPELAGTNFIPEGVVWLDMAKHYKIRCINEIFRCYHDDADTLSKASRFANMPGRIYYYRWLLVNDLQYALRCPRPFAKALCMLPLLVLAQILMGDRRA
jgi:glycosyltransferase involved in cell wall biosynthesis